MMVKPALSELIDKVDSKYTLVTISSKRARQIMAHEDLLYENPVTLALQELADGFYGWERNDESGSAKEIEKVNQEDGDADGALS